MKQKLSLSIIFKVGIILFSLQGCTNLLYWPDKILWGDPHMQNISYHEFFVPSFDGTKLLFWDVKTTEKEADNLVLVFHGNGQNLSAHIYNFLWLTKFKTDIVIFDYRGYGLSNGTPSPVGMVEDGLKALQMAHTKFRAGHYKKFIVFGQSLGGNILLSSLKEFEARNDISLLVLDSTFRNAQDVARYRFGPLGFLISGEMAADKKLAHITMPTLVIHSRYDKLVPFHFGEELFNQIPATKKEFWKLDRGLHADAFFVEEGKYRQLFLNYLQ
jgi:fermentation-respiration switch protein FrsA (DUF1100 family)